jgi:hypothetical protein
VADLLSKPAGARVQRRTDRRVLGASKGGPEGTNTRELAPSVLNSGTANIAPDVATSINPSSTGLFNIGSTALLEAAAAPVSNTQMRFLGSKLGVDNAASFGIFGINVGRAPSAGPPVESLVADTIAIENIGSADARPTYNLWTGPRRSKTAASRGRSCRSRPRQLPGLRGLRHLQAYKTQLRTRALLTEQHGASRARGRLRRDVGCLPPPASNSVCLLAGKHG